MKTKLKKLSDTRVEVTITLDASDLAPSADKAVEKLAKEVRVEGFRKGKVPAEVAKKFIPENDLNSATLDDAVRNTVLKAFAEEKVNPLGMPQINVTKFVPGEMAEYTATVDIVPEVKLCDYKKLNVKYTEAKIAAKDVNEMLDNLAKSYADKKTVDREAKLGDEAVIDFVGKKDGVEFPGGAGNDYALGLGTGTFIPGFEEGIVGHKAGDKFTLDITFPKDYAAKNLAGAKTTFDVTLKEVKELVKPEINDEFAKKVGPFKTLAELKKDIETNLKAQTKRQNDEKFKNDLLEAIVKKSTIATPEILVNDQLRFIRDDLTRNAESVGMGIEEYLEASGEDPKEFEKETRKLAEQRVKSSLALQKIAVEEKISVSDDVVKEKIAELRAVYKRSPEAMKSLKDPQVQLDIRNRMVIEKVLDFLVKENKK